MMKNVNKVLCHYQYGKPEEVIVLEEQEIQVPGPFDVLLETVYAPINPAEINLLEGKYGRLRPLPVTPGYDSVSVVVDIGKKVSRINIGDHVIAPQVRGSWVQYRTIEERFVLRVPKEVPLEQASMLNVNPMTALVMLSSFKKLSAGSWVIQNAANSGAGRAVIAIAKKLGFNTVNIVRREELIEEIKALGGTIVITEEQLKNKYLKERSAELQIGLALNAVGGENARMIARNLSDEGVMVTYGAMSKEPVIIDNGLFIFKNINATGFWRSKWLEQASQETVYQLYNQVIAFATEGIINTPVEAIYSFEEASLALEQAQKEKRGGKILLTPR